MSETSTPSSGGPQSHPMDSTERCLTAVDAYLRHEGLGIGLGEVPADVRADWRAINATNPRLDSETAYHWGSANVELGIATMCYDEPDKIKEAAQSAFVEALRRFREITDAPAVSRFDRGRARIAAEAVPLYFQILTRRDAHSTVQVFCSALTGSLKDAVAWYQKTKDPLMRRYANSLAAMAMIDIGFIGKFQNEFVATPIPSRYEAGLGARSSEASDANLIVWDIVGGVHIPVRLGQRSPERCGHIDPLLLANEGYEHRAGHTLGCAQAAIDGYANRALPDPARNHYIRETIKDLRTSIMSDKDYAFATTIPEAAESTPREWYGAHMPGMEITDRRTLRQYVNTMNSRLKSLPPADIEMLGWMCVEVRGDVRRYAIAQETLERAIMPYQEQGELAKSFVVAKAAMAAPLYGAVVRGSSDIRRQLGGYRAQLADLAGDMLEWRAEESLDPSQAPALDKLLYETTIELLLLSEEGSFLPLSSSPRDRGEYVDEERRLRQWDTTIFIADVDGAFSETSAARFRMGNQTDEASLDECVFTVTPGMLKATPGNHPLLRILLSEVQGEPISADLQKHISQARQTLERATRVVHLI